MSASVVGYAIPAAIPPPTRATNSTSSDGAYAASSDIGTARRRAEDEHQLAPVAVAERPEVQHRAREPE